MSRFATHLVRSAAVAALAFFASGVGPASAAGFPEKEKERSGEPPLPRHFAPEEKTSIGSVTVRGQRIPYRAIAGSLVVHPKGWDDTTARIDMEAKPGKGDPRDDEHKSEKEPTPEASMFFVAYFKQGVRPETRPITFIYNGGPGSATVWLHMGAFGPKRIGVPGDQHMPAAPYALVNNDDSLLDASDLVFIDMPGAGFSRIAGPGKEKAFWGVDQDAHAFAEFIAQFLGKYSRWNSPKYLFGESYGTTRSAVLINLLERRAIDFNGVMLLSQILNFALDCDGPEPNPGVDLPFELALPTYAATARYHHKLDGNPDLQALLAETEHFAMTDYALALQQGAALSEADRATMATKLHKYTGLPVDYIRKANLRITGGDFEKELLDGTDTTTGRIDTRFAGPAMDPLEKNPDYDPSTAAFGSAYVSTFNDYVRTELKYGEDRAFKLFAEIHHWETDHDGPKGESYANALNVMTDLATAMKYNPNLHVQLHAGYYDLATPFYEGVYEMQHLPIPDRLQKNIEYKFYESGHMVYAVESQRKALHDNAADFIRRTVGPAPAP
jgi:carboxypeptidase C (cathepsin A)